MVLLRDPVRRALSGFSHNCRHKRYVRTLRALGMLLNVDGDVGGEGAAPGPGGGSNGTVNSGPGKGLPWPLLLEQFGVAPGNGSRGDARRRRLLVPAGTVLQLRDLLALRALSAAAAAAAPAHAPSSSTSTSSSSSSTWSDASATSTTYRTLSYPCSADDFRDYYFGATGRAHTPLTNPPSSPLLV